MITTVTIVSVAPTNSSGSAGAGPANTVGITACPACSAPTGVMASNITTNSAVYLGLQVDRKQNGGLY